MIMTHSCEGIIAGATKISSSLSRVQEGSVLIEKMNEMRLCCAEFLKTIRRIKNFVPAHGLYNFVFYTLGDIFTGN